MGNYTWSITMIEFVVIAVVVVLIYILLKRRKKLSGATESAKPIAPESKPVVKTDSPAEPALQTQEAVVPELKNTTSAPVEAEKKPSLHKVAISMPEYGNKNMPQDSTLRRHYLANLRTMITSLHQYRPTDSMLCRHYETDIATNIEQCLHNEQAMQQLVYCYENYKKTLSSPVVAQEPQTIIAPPSPEAAVKVAVSTPEHNNVPQDAMLRRHYFTHLYAQIAAKLPTRPTDSTLRRHYDSMLENEVKKQVNG
jgi:hypothetical protein